MRIYAILDIGSSTVKLSVFNVDKEGQSKLIHAKPTTVNLAEGFYPSLMLGDEAIGRTVEAVIELVKEAKAKGALQIKAVSTGAARKAKNSAELVTAVKEAVSLKLEIISGENEAKILYQGVVADFKDEEAHFAAINIGGGSTELIVGTKDAIESFVSLPIGVSALNEDFLHSDPPTDEEHRAMVEHIREALEKAGISFAPKGTVLLHTGGELDYMVKTGYELENFDGSLSHPKMLVVENFAKRNAEIRRMTKEELHAFMPKNPRWMDGAIACNAIAETLARTLWVNTIVPSNKNLNDGLLLAML